MPKYRKLWVKTTDSLDLNEMPNDFTRLLWVLLPLGLCKEGRGLYSPAWVRSKIMPLREDINFDLVADSLRWFHDRGMITVYEIGDRKYFQMDKWHRYQGDTSKETETNFPAPELLDMNELLTGISPAADQRAVPWDGIEDQTEDDPALGNHPGSDLSAKFVEITSIPEFTPSPKSWTDSLDILVKAGVEVEDIETAVYELRNAKTPYTIIGLRSIVTAAINTMSRRKGSGGKNKDGDDKDYDLSVQYGEDKDGNPIYGKENFKNFIAGKKYIIYE